MQPDNILLGDQSPTELPQMQQDQQSLVEEKKMAKYSKTAEFARIQEHCQERIAFYQTHFPDGRTVGEGQIPTPEEWLAANIIIGEFKLLMNMYEVATEAVEAEQNTNK